MRKNKRDLWILLLVLSICALLIGSRVLQRDSSSYDPDRLIIETRYSERQAKTIALRQGQLELFPLPSMFDWRSGAEGAVVIETLGVPDYTFEFMESEYYLWTREVRYDWDVRLEQPGHYLALQIDDYFGRVRAASLYRDLPYNAVPWGDRDITVQLDEWGKNDW